jgi:hypothetical protein
LRRARRRPAIAKGGSSVPKKPRPALKKEEKKEGHKKEKREI